MAGNVSEWVADVYRPIIDEEANDFNYYREMFIQNLKSPEKEKSPQSTRKFQGSISGNGEWKTKNI